MTAYNNSVSQSTELTLLKQEQAQNEKYINNILSAIKNGIFSESTQKELISLEKRRTELEEAILVQEAFQQNKLSKEQILFFFKKFISEELNDEEAKTSIIETLVYKVILYDNKIRIILKNQDNFTTDGSLEELEKMCSNLAQLSPPLSHNPNIYFTKDFIILDYVFENEKTRR